MGCYCVSFRNYFMKSCVSNKYLISIKKFHSNIHNVTSLLRSVKKSKSVIWLLLEKTPMTKIWKKHVNNRTDLMNTGFYFWNVSLFKLIKFFKLIFFILSSLGCCFSIRIFCGRQESSRTWKIDSYHYWCLSQIQRRRPKILCFISQRHRSIPKTNCRFYYQSLEHP